MLKGDAMTQTQTVLAIRPMRSPNTGRMLGWTVTHALDCKWAHSVSVRGHTVDDYEEIDVDEIPPHVGRCGFCGGGR